APQRGARWLSSFSAQALANRRLSPVLALYACRLVERRAQTAGELERVVIRPEMHEEEPRLLPEHVAVHGGHFDSIRPQRLHYRIPLGAGQREVAGDRGFAIAGRLEVDRRGNPQGGGRGEVHAVLEHRIATGEAKLVDAAIRLSFRADDLIDLRSV